jgi:hypothetical protein
MLWPRKGSPQTEHLYYYTNLILARRSVKEGKQACKQGRSDYQGIIAFIGRGSHMNRPTASQKQVFNG